jgi:hypothetical protein
MRLRRQSREQFNGIVVGSRTKLAPVGIVAKLPRRVHASYLH